MKKFTILCVLASGVFTLKATAIPEPPTNLTAEVYGDKVTLTWECPNYGEPILQEDFENEVFPQQGWEIKTTNASDYRCSWFHYPTDDFKQLNNWEDLINSGEGSTMVHYDLMAPHNDGSPALQDEWLISPAINGAAYLKFSYFIDPMLLEYAQYDDFNDHYCVKISHDNGTTWETIWDAVEDSQGINGWQDVILSLGNSQENTKVAFVAQSDENYPEMGLYFNWAIDDVEISASKPSLNQIAKSKESPFFNGNAYRTFISKSGVMRAKEKIASQQTPIIDSYNIYLDDKLIAENIAALQYIDYSPKDPGTHTYKVVSVCGELISEAAQINVEIKGSTFNPPTNVVINYEYNSDFGSWDVIMTWSAPEGSRVPDYYNVYCEGLLAGTEIPLGEFGQTDVPNGLWDYRISAVYTYPNGESEAIGEEIALGTRHAIRSLQVETNSEQISLTWNAPKTSEFTVTGYNVWRATELIAENINETSFTDSEYKSGKYDYNVEAVYDDGFIAEAKSVSVSIGEPDALPLPYKQDFNGKFKPENWTTEKINENVLDRYMWSFSNPRGITIDGEGFDGGFASIDCYESALYVVASTLTSPRFDVSGVTAQNDIRISFNYDYLTDLYSSTAHLMYSTDNGETWDYLGNPFEGYTLEELGSNETCKPKSMEYAITGYLVGKETVMFQFNYDAIWDYHLAIDNFQIYDNNLGAIEETDIDSGISIRQFGDMINIQSADEIRYIRVYSVDGTMLHKAENINSGKYTVQTKGLGNGVKIICVATKTNTATTKIIIR